MALAARSSANYLHASTSYGVTRLSPRCRAECHDALADTAHRHIDYAYLGMMLRL